MSAERSELALAFIQTHPKAAAQVLERQDLVQVADYLKDLPNRSGRLILQRMLPQYSARIIESLPLEKSIALLSNLNTSLLAAILRYSNPVRRLDLLKALPLKIRSSAQLLLHYPDDAVGAWMQPQVPTVPDDITASDAIARIKAEDSTDLAEPVLVVNRNRQILGLLRLSQLIAAREDMLVTHLTQRSPASIRGRTTLYTARNHDGWEHHDFLVVVNQNKQLLGILTHQALRQGIQRLQAEATSTQTEEVTGLLKIYGQACLALLGSVSELVERHVPAGGRS